MNTTEKGNLFEERVYDLLLEALTNDQLFLSSKRSLLFKKKSYYSKDRENNIIFDLAIESYREGSDQPNLIVLIECKDYKTPVPIGRLEDFYSKKEQIARANSKCIFITTSSLQSAAFKYASNLGIGVIRVMDDDSMSWLIERSNKNLTTSPENSKAINVLNAITNEYFVSTHKNTFAYHEGNTFLSIQELIDSLLKEV
jgi:hypothetical protein